MEVPDRQIPQPRTWAQRGLVIERIESPFCDLERPVAISFGSC
jgi:hypothetical protein